jgi:hypothetical protein
MVAAQDRGRKQLNWQKQLDQELCFSFECFFQYTFSHVYIYIYIHQNYLDDQQILQTGYAKTIQKRTLMSAIAPPRKQLFSYELAVVIFFDQLALGLRATDGSREAYFHWKWKRIREGKLLQ